MREKEDGKGGERRRTMTPSRDEPDPSCLVPRERRDSKVEAKRFGLKKFTLFINIFSRDPHASWYCKGFF